MARPDDTSALVTANAREDLPTVLEKAVVVGDLSKLAPMERLEYYHAVCRSVGLNPLTKPFQYITLNGALTLYATKGATDQVRTLRGISIVSAVRDTSDPLYATWVVTGTDRDGRTDMDIGSVSIAKAQGADRANAIMKALTKAKRRLTLSLAGLGNMLDESEVDAAGAVPTQIDQTTGEVVVADLSAAQRMLVERATPEPAEPVIEAQGPATEPVEQSEPPADAVEADATAVCGDDGGMLGTCTRAPGHTRKHTSEQGEWPQSKSK